MRTARHQAGRHARGIPVVGVQQRHWDTRQRACAANLDLVTPGWLVMYLVYSRQFYAVPVCGNEDPVAVGSLRELREAIGSAEYPADGPGASTARDACG
jgi:hypothetical protein